MNDRLTSLFKDCIKFVAFAAVPGALGGFVYDWWVGVKLWIGISLVYIVAMLWISRRNLLRLLRNR